MLLLLHSIIAGLQKYKSGMNELTALQPQCSFIDQSKNIKAIQSWTTLTRTLSLIFCPNTNLLLEASALCVEFSMLEREKYSFSIWWKESQPCLFTPAVPLPPRLKEGAVKSSESEEVADILPHLELIYCRKQFVAEGISELGSQVFCTSADSSPSSPSWDKMGGTEIG